MTKKVFMSYKKLIIQELNTYLKELELNCDSPHKLRYYTNMYLEQVINDIKKVIKEAGIDDRSH